MAQKVVQDGRGDVRPVQQRSIESVSVECGARAEEQGVSHAVLRCQLEECPSRKHGGIVIVLCISHPGGNVHSR